MKLEKRDIAESFGLVYNSTEENSLGEYYHTFDFHGKIFQTSPVWDVDCAWEQAANLVLEPLVELLKSKLTA